VWNGCVRAIRQVGCRPSGQLTEVASSAQPGLRDRTSHVRLIALAPRGSRLLGQEKTTGHWQREWPWMIPEIVNGVRKCKNADDLLHRSLVGGGCHGERARRSIWRGHDIVGATTSGQRPTIILRDFVSTCPQHTGWPSRPNVRTGWNGDVTRRLIIVTYARWRARGLRRA
jgi:hypothetical protein